MPSRPKRGWGNLTNERLQDTGGEEWRGQMAAES